jgi:hypothetical protein
VRQRVSLREHFRRGNAATILIIALHEISTKAAAIRREQIAMVQKCVLIERLANRGLSKRRDDGNRSGSTLFR